MKRVTRVVAAVAGVFLLGGCLGIQIGTGGGSRRHEHPAPVVVIPGDPVAASPAELARIDAAVGLSFDHDRAEVLKRIASRADLSPGGQVYLADRTLACMSFDGARAGVLKALIRNPGFAPAAETYILRNLSKLSFESYRRQILNEIDRLHEP